MHALDEILKLFRFLHRAKSRRSRGIEPFVQSQTFLEQLDRFKGFTEVLFGRGQEVQRPAAIGQRGREFFDERDLPANFSGVGRFGGSAFDLILLLGASRFGADAQSERKKEEQEVKGAACHGS